MSHLEETVKRIRKWFVEGERQDPTKIDIFLTERCNLRCTFCNYSSTSSEEAFKEMNDKKVLKLIDEICDMDVKIFGVLGGEPFLRKTVLLEVMEKVKKHGIEGSIVTNGTLLKREDVEKIVGMEWDLIRFSIDGLGEMHDSLRGVKGAFDKTMNNIKNFHEAKKASDSNFPTVEVNFVLNNKNYAQLGEVVKKLSAYGVSFIYILPLIGLTESATKLKIDKNNVGEVNAFLKSAEETCKQYGVKSNIGEVVKKNLFLYSNDMDRIILGGNEQLPSCFLPWYTMNINSDGSVTPCAQWPKSEGIKLNGTSLRKIWFEDFEKMRESIRARLSEWCSRCCMPLVDENRELKKLAGL